MGGLRFVLCYDLHGVQYNAYPHATKELEDIALTLAYCTECSTNSALLKLKPLYLCDESFGLIFHKILLVYFYFIFVQ